MVSTIGKLDLLLTDLLMPSMNGDELARRLRSKEPDLKVLYLTGFSDRLFAERTVLWQDEAFLACTVRGLLEAASLATGGRTNFLNHGPSAVRPGTSGIDPKI